MKKLLAVVFLFVMPGLYAQQTEGKPYNSVANAEVDIAKAVKKAKAEHKNLFIQAGGNWCGWCLEFNRFCKNDKQVDSVINSDYIVYHLNYSAENKNDRLFAKYGYPQRFGFPVFLIVNGDGNCIHTQNSSYLEQGKTYNRGKVIAFLLHWNSKAVNPESYKNSF